MRLRKDLVTSKTKTKRSSLPALSPRVYKLVPKQAKLHRKFKIYFKTFEILRSTFLAQMEVSVAIDFSTKIKRGFRGEVRLARIGLCKPPEAEKSLRGSVRVSVIFC
jgi:hypothetical protein